MRRSFGIDPLYAPVPRADIDLEQNTSLRLYGHYLKHWVPNGNVPMLLVNKNLLQWARTWRLYDDVLKKRSDTGKTVAIGLRFSFELLDLYVGQFCSVFYPHCFSNTFVLAEAEILQYTKFFVAAMRYLQGLHWGVTLSIVQGRRGSHYSASAFPLPLPTGESGSLVFVADCGYSSGAFSYLLSCIMEELTIRVSSPGRRGTFVQRFKAIAMLQNFIENPPLNRADKMLLWNRRAQANLEERCWSPEQGLALSSISTALDICDEQTLRSSSRYLYVCGKPGSGKSEMLVHAAHRAARAGHYVLILCPTGTLVHSYRDRLPDDDHITVETIHSSFCISRVADALVQYAPPTRLRRYDLILMDEASQVEDHIAQKLFMAIQELPQRPFVCICADFAQLRPIAGGKIMLDLCLKMPTVELQTLYRTKDPAMLRFLSHVRLEQPERAMLESFWQGRVLDGTLREAVAFGVRVGQHLDKSFTWLCVTNKGAERVNMAALEIYGITEADCEAGFPGDPKVGAGGICARRGLAIRLTRNLDKDRGFVNGAIGTIVDVFTPEVFTVKLTTGCMVLVHPMRDQGEAHFLPCSYGYATTIRRAQGASLDSGCLFFDHCYPPEEGYGYVGASRFKSVQHMFHYDKLRVTDWIPVAGHAYRHVRSAQSEASSDDEQDRENELDYDSDDDDMDEELYQGELDGLCLQDESSNGAGGADDFAALCPESEQESVSDVDAIPLLNELSSAADGVDLSALL